MHETGMMNLEGGSYGLVGRLSLDETTFPSTVQDLALKKKSRKALKMLNLKRMISILKSIYSEMG